MKSRRILILASIALLATACSSVPRTTQPPDTASTPEAEADLSGNWILTTHSRMGAEESNMTVQQSGSALAGTLTGQRGRIDYTGSVEGNAVVFSFTLNASGNNLRIDYSGTVEGDTMQGKTVFGSFGEGTFSAKRKGS